MQNIERLIRRARVKMRMMNGGRVYRPPTNKIVDIVVDSMVIRFSYHSPTYCVDSASVVCLDYADESLRTIDSVLEEERA